MSPRESYYLPERKLVSQDDASIVKRPDVPRSRFTGSWTRKTAFDAGQLVPIMVDEILPGDHMTYDVTAYLRMATPLFPMFDNQRVDTFFFFVPCRLLWDNWPKFMGEQATPTSSIAFTVPEIELDETTSDLGSVFDHFGIPGTGQIVNPHRLLVNALPLRAYNLIYNSWFRDENLTDSADFATTDGPDSPADYPMQFRAKAHDYFTSALPWPQKFTAPTIPLGGLAPVIGIGGKSNDANTGPLNGVMESTGTTASYDFYKNLYDATALNQMVVRTEGAAGDAWPMVFADLSEVAGVTINTLRNAWLVQSLLERDARGGTRYTELIKSHFGVTNPDFRLQRPEYIGGGQSQLTLTAIAQTAPSTGITVGALGAAGTAVGQHRASYAATEHGYIIGLINVRSELSYQQGLHKLWSRRTRYDFYWPTLAGLGEQAILRQEIYATGSDIDDVEVFGYQERWHEYRTRTSEVTGIMRSQATGTLDAWHLAQRFTSAPVLNTAFIEDRPPMARILAAGALSVDQQYLADIMFSRQAVRPIPTFGTPVALGRF